MSQGSNELTFPAEGSNALSALPLDGSVESISHPSLSDQDLEYFLDALLKIGANP